MNYFLRSSARSLQRFARTFPCSTTLIVVKPFSTAAPALPEQIDTNDLRQRLTKIMEEKDTCKAPKSTISDDDLQDRVEAFQTRLLDAKLSLQDCSTEMDNMVEESIQANEAVEGAFAAYMDLLDDLRAANADQRQLYGDMSLSSAMSLKLLRQELDKIQAIHQKENVVG